MITSCACVLAFAQLISIASNGIYISYTLYSTLTLLTTHNISRNLVDNAQCILYLKWLDDLPCPVIVTLVPPPMLPNRGSE